MVKISFARYKGLGNTSDNSLLNLFIGYYVYLKFSAIFFYIISFKNIPPLKILNTRKVYEATLF